MSYPTPTCSWIGKRLEENALYTPKIAICVEKIMIDQWKQGHHIFSQAHIYFTCNSLLYMHVVDGNLYLLCSLCENKRLVLRSMNPNHNVSGLALMWGPEPKA